MVQNMSKINKRTHKNDINRHEKLTDVALVSFF